MNIKDLIRTIPNFPKEGIMFRDVTSLLKDAQGLKETTRQLVNDLKHLEFDVVAGIKSRGYILCAIFAHEFEKGFVPIRKKGKLPGETISMDYELEYGVDTLEVHTDAFSKGEKVLLIDDLLATGGTAIGAIKLVEKLGATVTTFSVIIDLPELKGKQKLESLGHKVHTLVEFSGH